MVIHQPVNPKTLRPSRTHRSSFAFYCFTLLYHSDGIDAPLWMFWKRRRYIVVFMAFLGFFNVYSLRVNLSVAIVAMTENRTVHYENGTVGYVSIMPTKPSWRRNFSLLSFAVMIARTVSSRRPTGCTRQRTNDVRACCFYLNFCPRFAIAGAIL